MYFSRRVGVIDSASHGNFANGPFRWFRRFGESWSYRSALRRRAYGGEMKALYSDVYIIVVHRNSPPPFFSSYHLLPFLRYSHTPPVSLFFRVFLCAPLLSSGFLSQASAFLFHSHSISIARFSLSYFICTINFSLIEVKCCSFIWVYDGTHDYFILVSLSRSFDVLHCSFRSDITFIRYIYNFYIILKDILIFI